MATKRRVEIKANDQIHTFVPGTTPAQITVEEKPGPVTKLDKIKGYYHTAIAVVGLMLLGLNQVFDTLPDAQKHTVSGIIGALTVVGIALKSNEQWFDVL